MQSQKLTKEQLLLIAKIKNKSNAIKNYTAKIESEREKQENKIVTLKVA